MFSQSVLSRAREYYKAGKAKKLTCEAEDYDEDLFTATVRGTRNYHVEIRETAGEITGMSCTCPYAQEGNHCKHMAATLMAIEDEYGKLSAPEEDGYGYGTGNSSSDSKQSGSSGTEDSEKKRIPMADHAAEAGDPSNELEAVHPDSLPELDALQKEEAAHRKEDASESGGVQYQPGEYRYFHPENFELGLNIKADVRKKAETIIRRSTDKDGKSGNSGKYSYGYGSDSYTMRNFRASIGYLQGKNNSPMVAQGTADFTPYYGYGGFPVTVTVGQDRILSTSCRSWDCSHTKDRKSYLGYSLCVHETAVLIQLEKYLNEHNTGDATSASARDLLAELMPLSSGQPAADSAEDGETAAGESGISGRILTLRPRVELLDGFLSATFYIGSSKPYKVKNIPEFEEAMRKQENMTFGTSTTLPLGENHLKDERSRDWYEFIEGVLRERDQQAAYYGADNYGYWPQAVIKANIPLYGSRLDEFAELAEGETFELWDKEFPAGLGKKTVKIRDAALHVQLEIHAASSDHGKSMDGIRMTGTIPKFIEGQRCLYYVIDKALNRVDKEKAKEIAPLVRASDNGTIDIRVGRSHLADFYHRALPALRKIADVTEYDTDLIARYIPPEPVFTAYFDTENQSVLCRLETSYGPQIFSTGDVADLPYSSEKGSVYGNLKPAYRDTNAEFHYFQTAYNYLPNYDDSLHILFCQKNDEQVFDLLDHGLAELMQFGEVRMTQRFKGLGIRRHVRFNIDASVDNHLLDLSVSAEDLTEDEMYEILYQYQRKRKFVKLKNGTFVKLDHNETVQDLLQIMETMHVSLKEFVRGKMQLPAYRALYLDKMLESTEDLYANRDRHFKQLIKEFKTVEDADFDVPAGLEKILRNYQKDGYRWLRTLDQYGFGGILADEMGLGKTLQVIAVLLAVKQEKGNGKTGNTGNTAVSLIVCPASLVYNWEEEIHRFAPELTVCAVVGAAADRRELIRQYEQYDVLVTSYDLLKRDIAEYENCQFRFEVIDEAQYIKNHTTSAAKTVKLIHAETRYALTGTPIENRLSELWSIFDYLMPGFLYGYDEFRASFELPISNDDETAKERLRRMAAPFILRRRKEDVLKDLPEKLEEVRYVAMGEKQQKLYDAQVLKMRSDLEDQSDVDFRKGKIEILAQLTRIRQLCCDPQLVYSNYDGGSAKREAVMDMIRSLIEEGHRALLFSQFTSMLELIEEDLKKEKIPYYKITGSTPKEKRMELVKAFNENPEEVNIFLISLKAGGTGLNLTGADVVIHYDPWWNTAAEDQATDRAHRIGQKKVVTVYKLIVRGSIEDRIMEMQERKRDLADQVLSGEGIGSSNITREDLMQILE